MQSRTVEIFSVIGAIATVIGVAVAVYFGYRSLSAPGIEVQGVSELIEETRTGNKISGEILTAVSPSDPIEGLARRGYSWIQSDFYRALRTHDETSAALFCDAGPVNVFTADLGALWTSKDIAPDRIAALKDCEAFDTQSICKDTDYLAAASERFDWSSFVQLCGAEDEAMLRRNVAQTLGTSFEAAKSYCQKFNAASDSSKDALSRNFMLTYINNKAWSYFGKGYSPVAFCDGLARYEP